MLFILALDRIGSCCAAYCREMSKLSFRARALDAAKPLPVFRCEDLPDLHEYASINRAVPQMPTGMEKEEESVCWERCFCTS